MLWQLCCWSNYIHSGKHEMLFCVFNNLFHSNQNFTLTSEKIIVSSRQKVCWNLSASFIAQLQYSAISLWNTEKSLTYSLFYKDYKDWTQKILQRKPPSYKSLSTQVVFIFFLLIVPQVFKNTKTISTWLSDFRVFIKTTKTLIGLLSKES